MKKSLLLLPACCALLFSWGLIGYEVTTKGDETAKAGELREVKLDGLTLNVPSAWKQQKPSNNLRLGQFEIPPIEGDKEPTELTIFNFGFGGGIKENAERWVLQFEPAERKLKQVSGKSPQGEYVLVDVAGTYKKPIGPPIQQKTQRAAEYRMLGVILGREGKEPQRAGEGKLGLLPKGNYFLKLVGPAKTVEAAAAQFRASFGGNSTEEKPYDHEKPE